MIKSQLIAMRIYTYVRLHVKTERSKSCMHACIYVIGRARPICQQFVECDKSPWTVKKRVNLFREILTAGRQLWLNSKYI